MKKNTILIALMLLLHANILIAAERNIPIDMFLMIDKSLSMAEENRFNDLHHWVRTELIEQMLIPGDWITIYQFYEKPEHLLTLAIESENDKQQIIKTIDAIKPDGQYTDIGKALDTINESLQQREKNNRFKVLLLVTDLKHDAPWTSRYAGKPESFESPYLAEARVIPHGGWFEVTLDMDIQDNVVKTTSRLYGNMTANTSSRTETKNTGKNEDPLSATVQGKNQTPTGSEKNNAAQTSSNTTNQPAGNKTEQTTATNTAPHINNTKNSNTNTENSTDTTKTKPTGLAIPKTIAGISIYVWLLSAILLIILIIILMRYMSAQKRKREAEEYARRRKQNQ